MLCVTDSLPVKRLIKLPFYQFQFFDDLIWERKIICLIQKGCKIQNQVVFQIADALQG